MKLAKCAIAKKKLQFFIPRVKSGEQYAEEYNTSYADQLIAALYITPFHIRILYPL